MMVGIWRVWTEDVQLKVTLSEPGDTRRNQIEAMFIAGKLFMEADFLGAEWLGNQFITAGNPVDCCSFLKEGE